MMKTILFLVTGIVFSVAISNCKGQQKPAQERYVPAERPADPAKWVGGPFENADFFYVGMPENIPSSDTSMGWQEPGQKILVKGTMYQKDGKTPAPGILLYYYRTNANGFYASRKDLDPQVARHGYLRGWVL